MCLMCTTWMQRRTCSSWSRRPAWGSLTATPAPTSSSAMTERVGDITWPAAYIYDDIILIWLNWTFSFCFICSSARVHFPGEMVREISSVQVPWFLHCGRELRRSVVLVTPSVPNYKIQNLYKGDLFVCDLFGASYLSQIPT